LRIRDEQRNMTHFYINWISTSWRKALGTCYSLVRRGYAYSDGARKIINLAPVFHSLMSKHYTSFSQSQQLVAVALALFAAAVSTRSFFWMFRWCDLIFPISVGFIWLRSRQLLFLQSIAHRACLSVECINHTAPATSTLSPSTWASTSIV